MAATQTHWAVPAIRTTGASKPVATTNQPYGSLDIPDHPEVERILRLRSYPAGRNVRWQATVCDVNGLREITWWSADDAVPCQAGWLIRTSLYANKCADPMALQKRNVRQSGDGVFEVSTVTPLWQVDPDINLLDTVPLSWLPGLCSDSRAGDVDVGVKWVERFRVLWTYLSRPMRAWFNALLWHHPQRLRAFLSAPGSMKHHHARPHGLFIHSVDCAWRALRQAEGDEWVNVEVLVLSALLHDVGKAAEYEWSDHSKQWYLSDRGALMGHRMTGMEWMATARGSLAACDAPDEHTAMAVYHAINACNAPDWVGLRAPRTPEALYLASVDALSGHCDLVQSHALPHRSRGQYHPAFRGGVYVFNGPARGMP